MSFILNALQKSDAERREQQQTPDLLSVKTPIAPEDSGKRIPRRWQLLSAFLLISVLVMGYQLFVQPAQQALQSAGQSPDATAEKSLTSSASPNQQASETAKPRANEILAITKPSPATDSPVNNAKLTTNPATAPVETLEATRAANQTLTSRDQRMANTQVIDLYQQPSATAPEAQSLTEQQQDLAARARQVKRDMAEPLVPAVHNLPSGIQNRLPKMVYSAHIYSSDADSGFAIINDRRRYRGDQIAPGLLVVSVISTGVVLTFEGYTFRLDAMKNWPLE
ncbi:hypothetical protein R50072_27770 [Simiduia litorea]|uniref:general secretion pathway protein GspB n=1 Tax=Simiduia litorea TaxID=1435348 RepID=UPI0036F3F65A